LIFLHDASKPSVVHGLPLELAQSVIALCSGAFARISVSWTGQGQNTGSPVFVNLVAISFALWKLRGSVSASLDEARENHQAYGVQHIRWERG
jgi:hypothetical protein